MKYIRIDRNFVELSKFINVLDYLYVEIEQSGNIVREIGFDQQQNIVHKYPDSKFRHGKYGIFDIATIDFLNIVNNDISEKDFNEIWNRES